MVAAAQTRAGDRACATTTLERALSTAAHVSDPAERSEILGRIAAAHIEAGDTAGVLRAVRDITDANEKARALASLARVQAKTDATAALETAKLIPDRATNTAVLSDIVHARLAAGDVSQASSAVTALPAGTAKARALLAIAAAQAKSQDERGAAQVREDALQIVRALASDADKASLFVDAARTLMGGGDRSAAAMMVQHAIDAAGRIPDSDRGKSFAVRTIARIQVEAGDARGALAFANRQTAAIVRAGVLLGTAEGLLIDTSRGPRR